METQRRSKGAAREDRGASDVRRKVAGADSERWWRAVFDQSPVGMGLADPDGRFVAVNASLCALLGRPEQEVMGRRLSEFDHPDDATAAEVGTDAPVVPGRVPEQPGSVERRYLRPSGEVRWGWLTTTTTPGPGGERWTLVHLQDVTARKASEQAAADSRTNLRAVGEVIRQIQSGSDARQTIVDAGRQLADASHVALIEPHLGDLRLHVTAATDLRLLDTSFPVDVHSVVVEVYRSGRSAFFPDPPADPTVSSELHQMAEARSSYLVPVRCADVVTGVLAVAWANRVPDLDDRRVEAVTLLVYHAGVALRQAALVAELEGLAMRDTLTLLPNRRGWELALSAAVTAAARSGRPLTVALADLDAFKAYNDAHGHPAGDELLRQVACSARENLREGDVVARWGGEEFAVALPNCPSEEAGAVLERIRHAMPLEQTCSIGFATWDGGETPAALMARADAALYEAKRTGRNRIVAAGGR